MTIDVSQLPAPAVIDVLDFESIFSEIRAELLARYPDCADVIDNESEPLCYLLQVFAYRELVMRQRINDSALAQTLAYAIDTDLDVIGQDRYNTTRLTIAAATKTTAAIMESDTDYRARIYRSMDALSTAGPKGAYESLAFDAHADVADAYAVSPAPGEVQVYILTDSHSGTPSATVLAAVTAAITDPDVRPMTASVTALPSPVSTVSVEAELVLESGLDSTGAAEAVSAARDALTAFADARHIGRPLALSKLHSILHVAGVVQVTLATPTSDIDPGATGSVVITDISVSAAGVV